MQLDVPTVLWVIGVGATLASLVFHGAFYLGQLRQEVRAAHQLGHDAHKRLDDHDELLGEMQQRRRTDRPYEAR